MRLVLINQEFMARGPGKNVPLASFAGRRDRIQPLRHFRI